MWRIDRNMPPRLAGKWPGLPQGAFDKLSTPLRIKVSLLDCVVPVFLLEPHEFGSGWTLLGAGPLSPTLLRVFPILDAILSVRKSQ